MKKHWDEIYISLKKFEEANNSFLAEINVPISKYKLLQELKKKWSDVVKKIGNFDTFISPVEEVALKLPEGVSDEFIKHWVLYKEYLAEQHGILMRSRMENASLEYLFEITNNDVETAIKHLKFYMTGYKGIFKIFQTKNQNQNLQTQKTETYDFNSETY